MSKGINSLLYRWGAFVMVTFMADLPTVKEFFGFFIAIKKGTKEK